MAKHIGIVSMSTPGTLLCYETICAEAQKILGPNRYPEISVHSFAFDDYLADIKSGNWSGVGEVLLRSVKKVAAAGADFAICPANTAHEAFESFAARSPIPLLHLVEVVAREAQARGIKRLGVLGTRPLMEGTVYPMILSARDIDMVLPDEEERKQINTFIYDELVHNVFRDTTREYFHKLIAKLGGRGCDGVVLGCTEIPLVVDQSRVELPLLDSTHLLAVAAVKEALNES